MALWLCSCCSASAKPDTPATARSLFPTLVTTGSLILSALLLLVLLMLYRRWKEQRQRELEAGERDRKVAKLTAGAHPDALVGTVFGTWRLVDRLGRSRTSAVYKAVPDASLDERDAVAIKIFNAEATHDPSVVEKFQRAVRASQAMRHPATIQVESYGEHDGRLFIVREYINGYPLRNRVRAEGMQIPEFFHIVRQVADALQHAHEHAIVHFDLKPDNIVVYGVLKIKIVDFGLDVFEDSARSCYSAPELVVGKAVDGRADQYALGVLIYEMLTGHAPVPDERGDVPTPSRHRADLPTAADTVVLRMLARAPEHRFPSVSEALDALEEALQARAQDTPVSRTGAASGERRREA